MPSNQELQARIKELEEQLLRSNHQASLRMESALEASPTDFAQEVWKAVLVGAVSSLFNPNQIPLDNRPRALDHYLKRALTIADKAAEVARNHRAYEDKTETAKLLNDPLKTLMGNAPDDQES